MEPANALDAQGAPAAVGGGAPGEAGLLEEARSLWQELRALAHDQFTLVALETRLAGKSLVAMIAAGVMIALVLVTAWLGLVGAAVLWLIGIGVTASVAMLLVVGANLALALILYGVIRRQSRNLLFPATLRSLRPVPSTLQTPEKS